MFAKIGKEKMILGNSTVHHQFQTMFLLSLDYPPNKHNPKYHFSKIAFPNDTSNTMHPQSLQNLNLINLMNVVFSPVLLNESSKLSQIQRIFLLFVFVIMNFSSFFQYCSFYFEPNRKIYIFEKDSPPSNRKNVFKSNTNNERNENCRKKISIFPIHNF